MVDQLLLRSGHIGQETMMIPFNKPYRATKELDYIREAIASGTISGDGLFTKKCHEFLEKRYGFQKCLLTTSCTDALEMAAILLNIQHGDEIIIPSFTFVSTANVFVLRGAKIIFCDSRKDHPGMDEDMIESLITPKTRAIVPVHYAGVACDMDKIMSLAAKYNLYVVEDAAQAINSYYIDAQNNSRPLGSIGHLAAFSFHETKNVTCGEGGMLVINDPEFNERAEIIREKGTNRSKFLRGEIDRYEWVDIGSSFLPSEISAAFLFAQLECIDDIQKKRKLIWGEYWNGLIDAEATSFLKRPVIPAYAEHNANMFYVLCKSNNARTSLIKKLRANNILSAFHYISLNKSAFNLRHADIIDLPESDHYTDCLLRLPFYFELESKQVRTINNLITEYCSAMQNNILA